MPSTVIRAYDYDPAAERLTVTFVTGRRYAYDGVPVAVCAALDQAFSKGRFFNRHIRAHYDFTELESDAAPAIRRIPRDDD